MARPKTPEEENEKRNQLMQATLDVIAHDGIDKVTARAVASRASVNQALVFYYSGSVTQLVIHSVQDMSNRRYTKYEQELDACTAINELIDTFVRVFQDDRKTSSFQVLSQFVSAAKSNKEIAQVVGSIFSQWIALTKSSLEKVLPSDLPGDISLDDVTLALMSGLLGIQFMAMIPQFERQVSELIEHVGSANPLVSMLPVLLGAISSAEKK